MKASMWKERKNRRAMAKERCVMSDVVGKGEVNDRVFEGTTHARHALRPLQSTHRTSCVLSPPLKTL